MPANETLPATDSATDLHRILGDDATATFEDDPNFVDSNPTGNASSENVEEQRSAAGSGTPSAKSTDDSDEDDDEDEDDVDEDDDLEDDEEDDDLEDEDDDEDDLDDESEDDDLEDEDDEDEDDADEVKASSVLRADGLLGYEDEADDVKNGVDRAKGDAERAEAEEQLNDGEKNYDPFSHQDGKWLPKERDNTPEAEGALVGNSNNADPDFVPPYKAAAWSRVEPQQVAQQG